MSNVYKIVESFHPQETQTKIGSTLTYQKEKTAVTITKFTITRKRSDVFPFVDIQMLIPSSFSMGLSKMIVDSLEFESDNSIFRLFNLDLKVKSESFFLLDKHVTYYSSNSIPFIVCDNYYASYNQSDKSITFLSWKEREGDPKLGTIRSKAEGCEIFSIKEEINLNPRWSDIELMPVHLTQAIQRGLISVMQIEELKNNPKVKLSREKRVLLAASLLNGKNE